MFFFPAMPGLSSRGCVERLKNRSRVKNRRLVLQEWWCRGPQGEDGALLCDQRLELPHIAVRIAPIEVMINKEKNSRLRSGPIDAKEKRVHMVVSQQVRARYCVAISACADLKCCTRKESSSYVIVLRGAGCVIVHRLLFFSSPAQQLTL